jgi:hypothetical protein
MVAAARLAYPIGICPVLQGASHRLCGTVYRHFVLELSNYYAVIQWYWSQTVDGVANEGGPHPQSLPL